MLLLIGFIICVLPTYSITIDCSTTDCLSAPVDCPENQDCFIRCLSTSICEGAIFNCPQDFLCDIDCENGNDACRHSTINGALNGPLSVYATDSSEVLEGALIHCPHGAICEIECDSSDDDELCKNIKIFGGGKNSPLDVGASSEDVLISDGTSFAQIYCPTQSPCQIECDDVNSCKGVYIKGPEDGPLFIQCHMFQSCFEATIDGPDKGFMELLCGLEGGTKSCGDVRLSGPDKGDMNITCLYTESCIGSTFEGGEEGDFNLKCIDDNACEKLAIYGPSKKGDLRILCDANTACIESAIYAPKDGDLIIHCIAKGSCYKLKIFGSSKKSDIFLYCFGVTACSGTAISGSVQGDIYVNCDGELSCSEMVISSVSRDNGDLEFIAKGLNAAKDVTISCPIKKKCIIRGEGSSIASTDEIFSNINIFSPQGFKNLIFECNSMGNDENCYTGTANIDSPRLNCYVGIDLPFACFLEKRNPSDTIITEWKCNDGLNDDPCKDKENKMDDKYIDYKYNDNNDKKIKNKYIGNNGYNHKANNNHNNNNNYVKYIIGLSPKLEIIIFIFICIFILSTFCWLKKYGFDAKQNVIIKANDI